MKNSIAIVGAGPGNGMAIARKFGREGFSVGLISRSAGNGLMVSKLKDDGVSATEIQADAADPKSIAAAVLQVEAELAPIDTLVFNAAAATFQPVMNLSVEHLISDFTVGVASALSAAQAIAPAMIARGTGTIIFTGGGFASYPIPQLASLGIQKAAIRNLAQSLASEFTSQGIRVGTITILGIVKPGTPFDPDKIAERFWALRNDRSGSMGVEVSFDGM
jgi:short-subunit dehydrogenase